MLKTSRTRKIFFGVLSLGSILSEGTVPPLILNTASTNLEYMYIFTIPLPSSVQTCIEAL